MSNHVVPKRIYYRTIALLLVLMVITLAVGYIDFGVMDVPLTLAVATSKAVLVILYFMHVRYSTRLTWVFAGAGFFWLAILFVFLLADYVSRVGPGAT